MRARPMIDGIPPNILAPSALAGLAVLLVFTGRLVPARTHNETVHDHDEWRAECRIKDARIEQLMQQNDRLLEVAHTVNAVLRSLPHPKDDPA